MKKTTVAICLFLLIQFLVVSGAMGTISKGPYLQNQTTDSISILWETQSPSLDMVEWGKDETLGSVLLDKFAVSSHEHRLTGLTKERLYYYRVTSEGQPGELLTFSTAPDVCSTFRFGLIGDTRSQHLVHKQNVAKLVLEDPDFIINTGDIVDHGDSGFENELVWQLHFNDERELLKEVPLYPVFGNHDTETESIWERVFALPNDESASEFYYSFKYGNSLFVVVNTQENYSAGSVQYNWLESTLSQGFDDPEVLHIFVAFHVPPYCVGDHGFSYGVINNLVPLFETYGVQAVLNGHEHNFQHIEKNGIRYFVSGGGAASLDGKIIDMDELLKFAYRHHYCIVTIEGPLVTLEVFDTFTGAMFYTTQWEDDMGKDPCPQTDDDDDSANDDDDDDNDNNDDNDDADDDDNDDGGDDDDDEKDDCCGC